MLQYVARVVPSHDPNRLRTELLFEVENGKLRLTGSNPQYRISGEIDLIDQVGNARFTVPPSDIVDYVRDLADQPLAFCYEPSEELKRGPLKMAFEGGDIRFTATDGENYPEFEYGPEEMAHFEISSQQLSEGLSIVLPSASQDTSRRAISSVCFRFFGDNSQEIPGSLDLVATDSIILSRYSIKKELLKPKDGERMEFILPPNCSNFLKTFLARYNSEPVYVSFSPKVISFKVDTVEVTSLLVDANFPNYMSIIPKSCEYHIFVDNTKLRTILRRMIKFIPNSGSVKLIPEGDQMRILMELKEENKKAEETMAVENPNSYTLPISLDKKKLLILLETIATQQVDFRIIDNSKPIVIAPLVETEENNPSAKESELINLISYNPE